MEVSRGIRVLWGAGSVAGLTDGQLLDRFAAGDEAAAVAFEAIVNRHGPAVLGACRRALADSHDADDAFQATFLVLVRRGATLQAGISLGPWLLGVTRKVVARARAEAERRPVLVGAYDEPAARSAGPSSDLAEIRGVLDDEIGRLPARYREAVVLCHFEGLTYEEAAARLGCPTGTVKSRLARARGQLRDRLARRGLNPSAWLAVIPDAPTHLSLNLVKATVAVAMSGTVSGHPVALAKAVLKEILVLRLKWSVGVLAVTVFATSAVAQQESGISTMLRAMGGAAATREDPNKDAELAVLKVEREWRDAIVRRDFEALDRVMADDYLCTDTGGNIRDKAQTLAAHRTGDYSAQSYEALETKVRIYGNTAVVKGLSRWKSGNSEDLRITSVYVKQKGEWRCVAWHGTVVGR